MKAEFEGKLFVKRGAAEGDVGERRSSLRLDIVYSSKQRAYPTDMTHRGNKQRLCRIDTMPR